jgi:long-chain acyl-CoA synthetase
VTAALDASGIASDAPVAFVARNHPAAIAAMLALLSQGRTVRMVYPFQSAAGIARSLARLEVAAAVMHAQDCCDEARGDLAAVVLDGMQVRQLGGPARSVRAAPPAPQIEILTSGTTGPPKQFAIPYRVIEMHFVASTPTGTRAVDPAAAPPALLYFPLGNISGIYSTLPPLLRGQRAVLFERFSVAAWHQYVLRHRPAQSGVPPSCMQQILDADIPPADLASIKAMGSGAAPLDPNVQRAFEVKYGIPVLISYGATEFAGPVASMTLDLHKEWAATKFGTVGRAMPGAKLRVVDPDSGEELPPGEQGVLQVVSPRLGPEWIATSDLAVIDADGFLFLKGRADGAIMRGGFKVLPETIEAALMLHPAVSEAAVTGIADARLGQVPAAALRLTPGTAAPAPSDLEAHLRQHVLATHLPVLWLFCDDLPRTPSHKVDRMALKALFESGLIPRLMSEKPNPSHF